MTHTGRGEIRRRVAVGAVIKDTTGRFLLVLRRNEPQAGTWTIPGGKVEKGESLATAVVREVLEETGLRVSCGELLWVVDLPDGTGGVYEVHDFLATPVDPHPGEVRAGDDAADAGWFTSSEMETMALTDRLLHHLRIAGQYP
ncbi:putative ADP-ribose pyrophosphatase [Gordonia effusa NBRC 100432]|uniref:Putative ADP-ribose pyrophosphatase n=1 Tax=Gordonia effusa NBRC 100432 TaxID=1077974 RepID=H0R1L4_9ACTN|nr:NUDIX domain-containing protein [Gordonia effusa]GAB18965.1 putative ADP-ribose pyrophosphatase [Gordonia effusa NBRC 100432]